MVTPPDTGIPSVSSVPSCPMQCSVIFSLESVGTALVPVLVTCYCVRQNTRQKITLKEEKVSSASNFRRNSPS